jgi:hypothetical protein
MGTKSVVIIDWRRLLLLLLLRELLLLRIQQQSLFWLPSGKRKRWRPRETLRRSIIREGSIMGTSNISEIKHLAMQHIDWRAMVSALCVACGTGGTWYLIKYYPYKHQNLVELTVMSFLIFLLFHTSVHAIFK